MLNRCIAKLATWMKLDSPAVTDHRRQPRVAADFPVYLSGPVGAVQTRCVDLNRRGLAIHTADPLPAGALVFLRIPTHSLMGFAHVRHCRPADGGHILGLEFREKLTREPRPEENWTYASVTPQMAWDEAEA